jgi:hypothetical protein
MGLTVGPTDERKVISLVRFLESIYPLMRTGQIDFDLVDRPHTSLERATTKKIKGKLLPCIQELVQDPSFLCPTVKTSIVLTWTGLIEIRVWS